MMDNLKFTYQTQLWGDVPFKQMNNFNEWYNGEYNSVYYYRDWDKILRYHAGAGYEGIEVMMQHIGPFKRIFGNLTNFKEFTAERGLQVSGMFTALFGSEQKENHERLFEVQKRLIDAVAELGGDVVTTMPAWEYFGVGPLSDEQISWIADLVNKMGEYGYQYGITPVIHNEFWCAVNLSNHEQLIQKTDPRYVGYCLDTAQVSILGADLLPFYEKYHERIRYFHLKDTTRAKAPDEERYAQGAEFAKDGTRWFWEPGGGNIDFVGLWKLMKKYQYKGWVCMETDGTPERLASMLLSKYYLDKVLKPIYK